MAKTINKTNVQTSDFNNLQLPGVFDLQNKQINQTKLQ